MSKKDSILELKGTVTSVLGNGNFKVEIHFNEKEKSIIIAYIAGRLRKGSGSFIRIVEGDKVKVEVSSYDTARGRIIYRFSDNIR